jgi:cytoskeletal protein CcmA (bactofilin family)
MPKDSKNDTNTKCGCNSNAYGKKVTTTAINNIEYSKKYTCLDEIILLHDTVIEGKLEVDGKVKVDGKLDVDGKFSLEGKLDVSGLSELNDVLINESLTVSEDTLLHDTIIDGSLNVHNLLVSDNANFNNVKIDGSLNIINIAEFNNVKINRLLECNKLTVSTISKLNDVTVDGSLNVVILDVSGDAVFNNNVTIDGSLNVVNLAELNSLKVNVLTECYDLNVLGSTQLDHARIINGVTVDGSLNAVNLDVSGDAVFSKNVTVDGSLNVLGSTQLDNARIINGVTVDGNLNAKNITFPDNTIQTTAYIPGNIIQTEYVLPYFFGTINFDNNVEFINSPIITFNNVNTWNTNDIIIKFSIFEIANNSKIYEGYVVTYPKSININETIINNLTIPCDNSPYFTIFSINGMNTSENISIILNNDSSNTSSLYFRFRKSVTLSCYYQVNCSIISGTPSSLNKISIENIDLDNFRSNV